MATVTDESIDVVGEAVQPDAVGDAEPQGASGAVAATVLPGRENWETELTTYKTSGVVNEPCVICVATDETDTNWKRSRYNYSMSCSSSVTDLYSAIAKEAGYVEGTFELVWRKQNSDAPGEEEVVLEWKSSATLNEMGMPTDPVKSYLLIREGQDGAVPQRTQQQQDTSQDVAVSSYPSTTVKVNNTSSSYSNSYSTNYYSNYSYSMKSETGFVGLVNQAMTCYLNSLLQTLYMTPEFRNALYSWKFKGDPVEAESSKSIPYHLQRLFMQLQTSNKRAVETTDVTRSFGWDSSEAWQQHDVQELCRVMFDALEKRFQKDKHEQPDLINDLYQGSMKDYVKCLACGYVSAREDHFLDIPLVIKPFGSNATHGSVEEALRAFVQPETLDGDDQYFCEQCNGKCDAHKGLKFTKFPYLLTLQLKRFAFDPTTLHRIKLNDRMTFPKVLDLNEFVEPADMPPTPDCDLEELYRDYVVERFDPPPRPPPYSSYARSSASTSYDMKFQGGSYTIQNITETPSHPTIKISSDNDESRDMSHDQLAEENQREGEEDGEGTEQSGSTTSRETVAQLLKRGPYVYELFSIMIHSGSAIGGHYYAYIKSFADRQWYCFNDQAVSKVTEEDIEQTFGGVDARSRSYYSSVYASSANAYMLMYRRVDKPMNTMFISTEDLPPHIKKQIEDKLEFERREKQRQEWERNLCKFRLFCRHPRTGEMIDKKLEIHKDKSFREAMDQAYKALELKKYVPLERCRLVKYDEYSETLDQSFEEQEDAPFGQVVGGPRSYYSYELFMEIRAKGEVFKVYRKGGLNLKVIVIDVGSREVRNPVFIRAEQGWRVADLKTEIAERLHLSSDTMRVALETYQSEGRHLAEPQQLLKNEGFYRKHTVFACCDPEDYRKDFRDSEMHKLIDQYANSILLNITIPPPPRRRMREPGNAIESSVDLPHGSQPTTSSDQSQQPTDDARGVQGENTQPSPGGTQDSPSSEQTALEEGSQTASTGAENTSEGRCEGESGLAEVGGSRSTAETVESQSTAEVGGSQSSAEVEVGQSSAEVEVGQSAVDVEVGQSTAQEHESMPEERPLQRDIQVHIDRRSTLANLKQLLEKYVQQSSSNFKIYRVYSNNQEYEVFRLNDTLMTVPNETRMIVRLGRALKSGEFRIRLFLLRMKEVEFCTTLMDSIIAKGMTVLEFKERIVKESYDQGIEYPLRVDRIRLRKKTWRTASTVYLNHQVFEKEIHIFAHFEMYVEPLEDADPMVHPTQMQVYLRRWRPSSYTVDPIQEMILDENTLEHLRKKISEVSDIPWERVEFAKSYGSFPSEMSVLEVEDELDWNPNAPTVSSMPLSIYDDGAILYYKDSAERLADLTPERRGELQRQENSRLSKYSPSGTSYTYQRPKEKPLRIYTEEDEVDKQNDDD